MRYKITDTFWKKYRELVRTEMIPFQWKVLNDAIDITIEKERDDDFIPNEKSHAIENFKIAAGRSKGTHYGWVFQDSDVYKWLEAAAYSLADHYDADLKALCDGVVELIGEAQEEDGYLNTYFSVMEPERRFKRLSESHELYCAGHFIEAAVAYYEAVGSDEVLLIAKKLADCICRTFGDAPGQIVGYDGHEEIELALMKLFHITKDARYQKTAAFFLNERGKNPNFFREQNAADGKPYLIKGLEAFPDRYYQNHAPIDKQDTAEGHAVRLVYMCTAMADLAASSGDEKMLAACKRIWRNIVDKRMYITGGIGSTVTGESFTLDYDLPNDEMYCETCASIGLAFFANRMLLCESDSEYADVMERALYNTVIAGMALDGKHFFYVNPLEVDPKKDKLNPVKSHVKPVRPAWLGCACCPPNLARMVTSLEKYIYTVKKSEILVNLFVDSEITLLGDGDLVTFFDDKRDGSLLAGDGSVLTGDGSYCHRGSFDCSPNSEVMLTQKTDYPRSGNVELAVHLKDIDTVRIGIRIPSWADSYTLKKNGEPVFDAPVNGYVFLLLGDGDLVTFSMDMPVQRYYANGHVSEDIGKVAIARGPFVYCVEGVDNGEELHRLALPKEADGKVVVREDFFDINGIDFDGVRKTIDTDGALYSRKMTEVSEHTKIRYIPYYAWANRGENEMRVWVSENEKMI